MPATSIKSSWSSGSLVFHEKTSFGTSTTYDLLTIGPTAVKVGNTANDVDFQYYGTGSLSWIIDCGAATMTNTGIATVQKSALTIGISGAGHDVTFYGDTAGCNFVWDQNGDTDGMLILGADTTGVDFKAFGATTGNYLLWDKSTDDLLLVGTATQLAVAGTTESTSTTTGSLRTAGGLACVGDFYAGDDIFLTTGAVLDFAAANVTLTHSAGALACTGALTISNTTASTTAATGALIVAGGVGIAKELFTTGTITVGVTGAGHDVTFYGDTTGCNFLWDQNGDTDGSLILGADTTGVDFKAFGATTGNYLLWDKSADDLLLVGTATQLAVAGTTASTSSATGSLRTAGGLGVAGDVFVGGDVNFSASVDSAAVADQVSLGGYEISAGHRALAISSEEVAVEEVDESKFSHKLPVRINGATLNIMLCAT